MPMADSAKLRMPFPLTFIRPRLTCIGALIVTVLRGNVSPTMSSKALLVWITREMRPVFTPAEVAMPDSAVIPFRV